MAARKEVINLYKSLLREGSKFSNYNFRMYTKRKVRDSFRENINISDSNKIESLVSTAKDNLALLRRQVIVDNLYKAESLVIDKSQRSLGKSPLY